MWQQKVAIGLLVCNQLSVFNNSVYTNTRKTRSLGEGLLITVRYLCDNVHRTQSWRRHLIGTQSCAIHDLRSHRIPTTRCRWLTLLVILIRPNNVFICISRVFQVLVLPAIVILYFFSFSSTEYTENIVLCFSSLQRHGFARHKCATQWPKHQTWTQSILSGSYLGSDSVLPCTL